MSGRRTVLLIAAFALVASFLVTVPAVMEGDARLTVHVSGDWPGALDLPVERAPLDEARVRVVMLTSWDKLRHIEGAAFLCGSACEARPGPRAIRIVNLTLPGVTKDVLIRLAWDAVEGPGPKDIACATELVIAETTAILPNAEPCWDVDTRWRLPFGLGVWG